MFYYPGFESERDADRLGSEVRRVVSRPAGYDAVAKVRTSAGITVCILYYFYYYLIYFIIFHLFFVILPLFNRA